MDDSLARSQPDRCPSCYPDALPFNYRMSEKCLCRLVVSSVFLDIDEHWSKVRRIHPRCGSCEVFCGEGRSSQSVYGTTTLASLKRQMVGASQEISRLFLFRRKYPKRTETTKPFGLSWVGSVPEISVEGFRSIGGNSLVAKD